MVFIPASEKDYFKLSCTSRKSGSRTSSGAKFLARERSLIEATKRFTLDTLEKVTPEFSNTRLVYVCA